MSLAKQLREELDRMVNVQFETPEFIKFLSIKYTMPRARFLALEMAAYTRNRRDCWGCTTNLWVKRTSRVHEPPRILPSVS